MYTTAILKTKATPNAETTIEFDTNASTQQATVVPSKNKYLRAAISF